MHSHFMCLHIHSCGVDNIIQDNVRVQYYELITRIILLSMLATLVVDLTVLSTIH